MVVNQPSVDMKTETVSICKQYSSTLMTITKQDLLWTVREVIYCCTETLRIATVYYFLVQARTKIIIVREDVNTVSILEYNDGIK